MKQVVIRSIICLMLLNIGIALPNSIDNFSYIDEKSKTEIMCQFITQRILMDAAAYVLDRNSYLEDNEVYFSELTLDLYLEDSTINIILDSLYVSTSDPTFIQFRKYSVRNDSLIFTSIGKPYEGALNFPDVMRVEVYCKYYENALLDENKRKCLSAVYTVEDMHMERIKKFRKI